MPRVPVEQVVKNVLANIVGAKKLVQAHIFQNAHSFKSEEILAALGTSAPFVTAWLDAGDAVVTQPKKEEPPVVAPELVVTPVAEDATPKKRSKTSIPVPPVVPESTAPAVEVAPVIEATPAT